MKRLDPNLTCSIICFGLAGLLILVLAAMWM